MSANKIFKANSRLYVVTELLLESNYEKYKELETLIHHLDDWFLHYSIHENSIKPNLLDDFVFESVTGSISYPSSIIKKFI